MRTNQGIPTSTYNGQAVKFADIGVGGTANFSVSKPVVVQLAPLHPHSKLGSRQHHLDGKLLSAIYSGATRRGSPTAPATVRSTVLGTDDVEVVGMPALAGKVMVVDTKHLNDNVGVLSVLNGGRYYRA